MLNKKLVVYVFIFVGVVFSFLVGLRVYEIETKSIQKVFEKEVEGQVALINQEVLLNIEVLRGLKILFDSSEFVSHDEFATATREILINHKSIKALEWIPRVKKEERKDFENERRKYFPNFEILKKSSSGIMEIVEEKEHYFPISYLEPYVGNETALGFDLSSNEIRNNTLIESMEKNKVLASESIKLVQDGSNAFLVFIPFFKVVSVTKEQRNKNLEGFILGVFNINDIFSNALKYQVTKSIVLELLYEDKKRYFYKVEKNATDKYTYYSNFNTLPSQNLIIKAQPKKGYIESRRDYTPVIVFIIGVLFSITAGKYTLSIITYSESMEKEVASRTKALNEANKRLEELSKTDGLTKVYNRRYFDESFDKEFKTALRNSQSLSLLMIDIDYFKNYNDAYGHIQGDKCLQLVASSLVSSFHRPGDIVSRYGGEEFVVLLPNTNNVDYVCKSLLKAIRNLNIEHKDSKVSNILSISIGAKVLEKVDFSITKEEFLEDADKALYEAKESGRNTFIVH